MGKKKQTKLREAGEASAATPDPAAASSAKKKLDVDTLSARQRRILEVIRDAIVLRGYPPSIREIGDAAGLPRLVEAMRRHGYGEALVAKLCRGNWMRVLARTWGEPRSHRADDLAA